MNNALISGLFAGLGLVPALVLTWLMRRSLREPRPGPTYAAAGVAVLVGIALAYGAGAVLGVTFDVIPMMVLIAAGGFAGVYGELGRVQASWRAREEEEAGPA